MKIDIVSCFQAAQLLGMDAAELGAALRRRKVRIQHAGRESLHEAGAAGDLGKTGKN